MFGNGLQSFAFFSFCNGYPPKFLVASGLRKLAFVFTNGWQKFLRLSCENFAETCALFANGSHKCVSCVKGLQHSVFFFIAGGPQTFCFFVVACAVWDFACVCKRRAIICVRLQTVRKSVRLLFSERSAIVRVFFFEAARQRLRVWSGRSATIFALFSVSGLRMQLFNVLQKGVFVHRRFANVWVVFASSAHKFAFRLQTVRKHLRCVCKRFASMSTFLWASGLQTCALCFAAAR